LAKASFYAKLTLMHEGVGSKQG